MAFHLPNESAMRQHINYTQAFALTLLWNIGLLGMLVTFLFILFLLLKHYQLRIANNKLLKESMLSEEDKSPSSARINESQKEIPALVPRTPKSIVFRVVNVLTSIFFYCFWVVLALIYLCFFMFGYYGRGTHIDVLSVVFMLSIVVVPALVWKHKTKTDRWSNLRGQIIFTAVSLALWLGVCITLVLVTKGTCVCYYNQFYGFKIDKDAYISTEFTRSSSIEPPCPQNQICHLYATLPQDGSTAVFFNVQSGLALSNLTFTLTKQQKLVAVINSSDSFQLNNVQTIGQRWVHSVLFQNLTPDTTYNLVVSSLNGTKLKSVAYKTVPDKDAAQLRLGIGGDVGMTHIGQQMTLQLSSFNPDAIILGGDTVYDDGMRSCYNSWDNFYHFFEPLYQNLGRIVPLVMSIGNHDVGYDALTQNQIDNTTAGLPLFLIYNPQHSSSQKGKVPGIFQRKSIHYHKIGPTIHFNLDSGYMISYQDQVPFITETVAANPKLYRFANYHNPLYPSCTDSNQGSNDMKVIAAGLKYWVPVFDRLQFTGAMEHHTHYMKMSHRLANNTISQTGTRYIGDGSWGVTQEVCSQHRVTPNKHLLQKYFNQQPTHVWQLTLKKNSAQNITLKYTAVNVNGTVVIETVDQLKVL